jgi:hypothetical protein
MSDMPSSDRLNEIADQVRDGWIRCRGPLTGMKALVAARNEARELGAGEQYMELLDQIVAAAKALDAGQSNGAFKDATRILDVKIPLLRQAAEPLAA